MERIRVAVRDRGGGAFLAGFAAVALVAVAVVLLLGGGDGSGGDSSDPAAAPAEGEANAADGSGAESGESSDDDGEFAQIRAVDSSWVRGQASLVTYDAYQAVANRADELGREYQSSRDAIAAEQLRQAERERDEAERAARERALAAYREALRKAKLERQRQQRRLAERRRRIKERLEELREKHKVEPGEECQIPEVQAVFDCSTGYPF
ncbi:MAG: hypothetical protein ACRDL6_11595 [Solirubrobacterales bacterium]